MVNERGRVGGMKRWALKIATVTRVGKPREGEAVGMRTWLKCEARVLQT